MDFTKLDELIGIKKKSDASKTQRTMFYGLMTELYSEEGLSDTALKYQNDGFSFCGATPLFDHIIAQPEEEQPELIKQVFCCGVFKENEKGCAFRMGISMLCCAANNRACAPVFATIISRIPAYAVNKKKEPLKDISATIERYLISQLNSEAELPALETLNTKEIFISEFVNLLTPVLKSAQPGKKTTQSQIDALSKWLSISTNKAPANTEKNEEAPADTDTHNAPQEDGKKSERATPMSMPEFMAIKEQTLMNFERIGMSLRLNARYKEQIETKNAEISSLQSLLKTAREKISQADAKVCQQREEISSLEAKIFSLTKEVASCNSELCSCKEEIERLSAVTSVYAQDKADSQNEILNSIAAKLKIDYRDFNSAEDMEMTTELGEIMRCQLASVFKILKKNGIDMDGE